MRVSVLASLTVASALLAAAASAASASPAPPGTIIASVPRVAFQDLGGASGAVVHLAVALRYRNDGELRAFAEQQPELLPGHQVLSTQQFRAYFSPSPSDYERAATMLTRLGFHIERLYANRTVIDVAAPAMLVDRVFSTDIHSVLQQSVPAENGRAGIAGGIRYANLRPAILPAELRSLVFSVIGFNDLITKRPTYVLGQVKRSTGVAIGPPLRGPDGGFGPFAFAEGYNFPVQHQVRGGQPGQTYDGSGQATANVIDSDFKDSDLASFLSYFGIKRTGPATTRVLIDGGPHPLINGDEIETDLDVETMVGTTPGTALYVYLLPNLDDQSIYDGYNQIVSDDIVDAANSSFAGCESQDPEFATTTDHIAMQGVALGINFSASSGDDGSAGGCVSSPASGPHFIATGGTTLQVQSNGMYESETGWDGSGGGVSALFPRPTYQDGIQNVIGDTRNVPDISFDANPFTGASLYIEGQFDGPIGGTSLSSPLTTALVTQVDQFNGSRLGDLHPGIYTMFRRLGYRTFDGLPAFRDVIGGSNGMYQCTQGYDLVTGIGSVDGAGAANAYKPE